MLAPRLRVLLVTRCEIMLVDYSDVNISLVLLIVLVTINVLLTGNNINEALFAR